MKKIVIIGGGFAGINFLKYIEIERNNYNITLVDRNNYMFFPPLLYQVATGFLAVSNISYPYRKMFRNKSTINFKLGEVLKIEYKQKKVVLTTGELNYDYLLLATGTITNFFGLENIKKNAIPMKTINDAIGMRNYLLSQFELATTLMHDEKKLQRALTIVIIGGGPTGVEIAGMLSEMHKYILYKDYPEFKTKQAKMRIYLVESGSQLLSAMSKNAQKNTYDTLKKMQVEPILNVQVKDYIDHQVILSNGETIETDNIIWAAGVTSQTFEGLPKECYGQGNRIITDAYNKVYTLENIYAIGDTCIQTTDVNFPTGHPQIAQVALQQGKHLAYNFKRFSKNQPLIPFKYKDKGKMAIIGRNKAVVDIASNFHLKGILAWLIWIFIHLMALITYRNKITTLYNWVISYFTKDQALRMIIQPTIKRD